MNRFLFLTVFALLIVGCAASENSTSQKFDFAKHARTGQVKLDSLLLTRAELPEGYSFGKEPLFMDIQTEILFENPMIYGSLIGGGSLLGKAHQTIVGPNDKGSVLFLYYNGVLNGATSSFIGGVLWGESSPTSDHPEEFFVNNNIILIWSFPRQSPAKTLSQQKVMNHLNRVNP